LYRTFLDQNRTSDNTVRDTDEQPVHPTERTIVVRTLCDLPKYKEARGTCARRKFSEPITAASDLELTEAPVKI
jgi:hypothetical protein